MKLYIKAYQMFSSASSRAFESWSGQDVPLPRQSMPFNLSTASFASIPLTSIQMPWVLPEQPPTNSQLVILPLSSSSRLICLEQTPVGKYEYFIVIPLFIIWNHIITETEKNPDNFIFLFLKLKIYVII